MEKIFVVIPNWNGADLIVESLRSLMLQTKKARVVVVDNGSVDESVSVIESQFPDVELIRLPQNTGFSGGVNTGIQAALGRGADAVALFNNDAVADKDWLIRLVETLESDENIGIVSSKQLRSDKKHLDSTGDFYSVWGMPFPRGRNQVDSGQYDSQEAVFSAPAGATLYRASLFNNIGLFDEKFFAYYEDVDISFRAQLAGWKIMYQPKAKVYHHVSATGSKLGSFTRYHATKNFYLLYAKNMPGWLYWKYLPLFALQALRLFASSILRGGVLTYLRAVGSVILLTPHIIRERRRIQKSRRVPIRDIEEMLYKQRPPRIPTL
jgi:GT2 family glycosyltransferase